MFLLRRRCTITWPRGRSLRVLESRLGREDSSPCSTQRSILENSSNNYPQRTTRIGRRRNRAYRIPKQQNACPDSRPKQIVRLSDLKRYSLRTFFYETLRDRRDTTRSATATAK